MDRGGASTPMEDENGREILLAVLDQIEDVRLVFGEIAIRETFKRLVGNIESALDEWMGSPGARGDGSNAHGC